MLINIKDIFLSLANDIFILLLVFYSFQFYLMYSQSLVFWFIWMSVSLIGLQLTKQYTNSHSEYFMHKSVRMSIFLTPFFFLSYPLLNDNHINGIQLLLMLLILTVTLSNLASYITLYFFSLKKQKSIIFLLSKNNEIYFYKKLKKILEKKEVKVRYQFFNSNTPIEKIKFSQYDKIIYSKSLNNNCTSTLLEEKIKGAEIVDFVIFYSQITGKIPLDLINKSFLLDSSHAYFHKKNLNCLIKIIDLFVGSLLFVIFIIPALIISIIIHFESKGSIIFKQERIGKNMKPFTLYKFRSMSIDAEKKGPQWATKNDPRATKVGSLLRKTHLDEIPQIVNVLSGDMSLVGPRPIRLHFTQKLTKQMPLYYLRNFLKPGLTGWAQINAPRGSNMKEEKIKLEMDLYYLQNASIIMNLYILLGTVKHMLAPSDNSHFNSSTNSLEKKL